MTSSRIDPHTEDLSRRERQIMDVLYARGRASVTEVLADIPDPPGYSAVRALLRTLEQKGHIKHEEEGRAYLYRPTTPRDQARKSALKHLLSTFFAGSTEQAIAALLEMNATKLSKDELKRLSHLVDQAKKDGR